jgi:competence protein ComFB
MRDTFHNIVEDKVIARVDEIFKTIEENGYKEKYCTCNQCRMDTICYALNRLQPHYIISHRGAARVNWEGSERQQQVADITTVIYEGLKRVSHNQRPNFSHNAKEVAAEADEKQPVFNVPTIMGRLFNGENFAPIYDAVVKLLWNNELVAMKDGNWQNPYQLVPNAEGNFSFWPAPASTTKVGNHRSFEYTLRVTAPEFETLEHFFKIPVVSEIQANTSFTLDRTFKLPDLYMFLPGEAEKNDNLD